ncbi:unnamed protein product [Prunus armeniaca]
MFDVGDGSRDGVVGMVDSLMVVGRMVAMTMSSGGGGGVGWGSSGEGDGGGDGRGGCDEIGVKITVESGQFV